MEKFFDVILMTLFGDVLT